MIYFTFHYTRIGASDIVYTCMVELLELHEDGQPGRAKMLAKDMLAAVFSSAAWGSKSTYPPLALAVSHVGAEEVSFLLYVFFLCNFNKLFCS